VTRHRFTLAEDRCFFCFCGFHQTSSFAEKNVEQQKENWKIGRNYIFLLSNKTAFLVSEYECSRK